MQKPAESPECYGSHLWSATEKECVGGVDPGYKHPSNGTHVRERCKWYQPCGQVSAQQRAQSLIPASNLVRYVPPPPPPAATTLAGVQPPPKPVAPHPGIGVQPPRPFQQPSYTQHAVQPAYMHAPQVVMVPPYIAQQGPMQVPLQYQQPGAQMPAYLTIPEPVAQGESALGVLFRTLLRSALKACGHSLSSFVDHTPFRSHRPPEQ